MMIQSQQRLLSITAVATLLALLGGILSDFFMTARYCVPALVRFDLHKSGNYSSLPLQRAPWQLPHATAAAGNEVNEI